MKKFQIYYVFFLLLTACAANDFPAPVSDGRDTVYQPKPLQRPAANRTYSAQNQSSDTSPEQQEAQSKAYLQALQYANQALHQKQPYLALSELSQLDPSYLSPKDRGYYWILYAYAHHHLGEPQNAFAKLNRLDTLNALPVAWQISAYQLFAKVTETLGNYWEALNYQAKRHHLLEEDQQKKSIWQTWRYIQRLKPDVLKAMQPIDTVPYVRGWVALGKLYHIHQFDLQTMERAYRDWETIFPTHPAHALNLFDQNTAHALDKNSAAGPLQTVLPGTATYDKPLLTQDAPRKIAVLLPLSGRFQKTANLIQEGLLAAYYEHPVSHVAEPEVQFFDTAAKSMDVLVTEIANNGFDLVVGPLLKDNIQALPAAVGDFELPPFLILNQVPNATDTLDDLQKTFNEPALYFALAPEEEARNIAEKAHLSGHRTALVLTASNAMGERMQRAFKSHFESLGGEIVGTAGYSSQAKDWEPVIKKLLLIDESELRKRKLEKTLGKPVVYQPRHREDADVIFLAASAQDARQIKPRIDYYFAQGLPIFATSSVHGLQAGQINRDLESILFCDMPVLLDTDPNYQALQKAWGDKSNQAKRLLAFGADAWLIAMQYERFFNFPSHRVQGLTGQLYQHGSGVLMRDLSWAKYQNGQTTPVD